MPPSNSRRSTGTPNDETKTTPGVHASPDGRWIAFESDRDGLHGVWLARRDGSDAQRISGGLFAALPVWSPDSSRLAFFTREFRRPDVWSLRVAQMPDGRVSRVTWIGESIAGASWFPDSRRICYGNGDRLVVLDTVSGAVNDLRVPNGGRVTGAPAVAPDGGRVVFAVTGDGAWMASLPDGAVRRVIVDRDVDAFAWAPGGRQIAFRTARDGQWKIVIP